MSENWIRFEGRTYPVGPAQTALDALRAGGAPVSFSCRSGVCQSCLLEALEGEPGEAASATLPPEYRAGGLFLPCRCTEPRSVHARRPDLSALVREMLVAGITPMAPSIVRLSLEPVSDFGWHAGQTVELVSPDGASRPYSIVSVKAEDYFLELDVRLRPGGAISE